MHKAGRIHGLRFVIASVLLLAMTFAGLSLRNAIFEQQARICAESLEKQNATRAAGLVDSLRNANIVQVPGIIAEIENYRQWASPLLKAEYEMAQDGTSEKLHAALALLPVDRSQVDYLRDQLPLLSLEQFSIVREVLKEHQSAVIGPLWELAQNDHWDSETRFQAACALATFSPDDQRWSNIAVFVTEHLVLAVPSLHFGPRLEQLKPARPSLIDPLRKILEAPVDVRSELRPRAAMALAEFLQDQPEALGESILWAENDQEFLPLFDALTRHPQQAKDALLETLQSPPPPDAATDMRDAHWKKQAIAAVALLGLGETQPVWPLLKHSEDPSLRSFVVHYLGHFRADHQRLAKRLEIENQVSIRRALILSLGGLNPAFMSQNERNQLANQIRDFSLNDPDPGIHSAAEWTLERWGEAVDRKPFNPLEKTGSSVKKSGSYRWYVNHEGQTMVVVANPSQFGTGAIDDPFAVSAREVTVEEFRRFRPDHSIDENVAPQLTCPVNSVSWHDVVAYCNWLSKEDGIPPEEWCYEPIDLQDDRSGFQPVKDCFQRIGYRLPTEAEWEFACRGLSETVYCFGEPLELLSRYGWYGANSKSRTYPVGTLLPNDLGFFDMHGNLWEWSHANPSEDSSLPNHGRLRGGSFGAQPSVVRSRLTHSMPRMQRTANVGFRVARTYR